MNKQITTTFVPALSAEIMNHEVLAAFAPVAFALPSESIRAPFLPVARFIDDCFVIVGQGREQLASLAKVGMQQGHVDVLEHRVAGLKAMNNLWNKARVNGASHLETVAVDAEALRFELVGFLRATLNNHSQLLSGISALEMNDTVASIHADLTTLNQIVVDAGSVFAALNVDVKSYQGRLTTLMTSLDKGQKDIVITDAVRSTHAMRNRMFTLAVDSCFHVVDCAYGVFASHSDRSQRSQWSHFASMAEYGWSL